MRTFCDVPINLNYISQSHKQHGRRTRIMLNLVPDVVLSVHFLIRTCQKQEGQIKEGDLLAQYLRGLYPA